MGENGKAAVGVVQIERESDRLYDQYRQLKGTPEEWRGANELYAALSTYASKVVYIHLGRVDDDLAAEIVSRAFIREPHFKGDSKFSTWFFQIARNVCVDHIRRETRRREVPLWDGIPVPAPDDDNELFEAVADALAKTRIAQLLELLTPAQRALAELRLSGLSHNDIAKMEGVEPDVIRCRWKRLIKRLRKAVAAEGS